MGIDLTLLPYDCQHYDLFYSHTILSLDRDYDLFDEIKEIEAYPQMELFSHFMSKVPDGNKKGEYCYGADNTDAYGEQLQFVFARDLIKLDNKNLSNKNTAVMAYLRMLPGDQRVALYWH